MAAATTHLPPSATKAPSTGDSVHTTTQQTVAGQSSVISMDHSSYPDPSPSETYPAPVPTRIAQATTPYDGQAPQQLIGEDDMNHNFSHDMSRDLSHGFVGHDGSELSNGHPGGSGVQGHRYPPGATHANGPPATPHQQHMIMVGQHTGMDPNQELSLSNDASRRKRSKVSRACDECRRKKIKCDATLEDGSHQTCNNCKRGQALCTFDRVPQKRGPSKGYIQELSNRVQQIESQAQAQEMRMSQLGALPVALRASLDAGDTSRMYTPEGYTSAPDDGDSLNQGQKRKFSELHDGQASSPFAQPRFVNNDRMPSLGGWPMNAQPSMNPTNQGHRNSISLAPDQTLDNIEMDSNRQETERPFWVQNTLKPPKSEPRTENVVGFPAVHHLVQELYNQNEASVSGAFSFLPRSRECLENHISACDNETCYSFATAMKVTTRKTFEGFEGFENKFDRTYENFEHHIRITAMPLQFESRPFSVNLVRMWTLIFMMLHAENDLARVREHFNGAVGKLTVLELSRMAIKLCTFLLEDSDNILQSRPDEVVDSDGNLIRRSWNCIAVLATWTEIGCGITYLVPPQYALAFARSSDHEILGPVLFYLSGVCLSLGHVYRQLVFLRGEFAGTVHDSSGVAKHHLHTSHLDSVGIIRPLPSGFESYLDAATAYFDLIVSRSTLFSDSNEILEKTVQLVSVLHSERFVNANYRDAAGFPLFINHFYNLAVITLLELGVASTSPQVNDTCHQMITLLRRPLDKQVEAHNENPEVEELFWAQGLLKLIEATPFPDGKDLEGTEAKKALFLDFAMLARKGTSVCVAGAVGA